MPPIAASCVRFILASVALLIWLRQSGRLRTMKSLNSRQWWGLAWASATGVLGYAVFFMLALRTVPAGKAAMVVALNPVFTMLFAAMLFREPVNWKMGLGLIMAVVGATYALSGGTMSTLMPNQTGTGELLLLGCVACWVAYTLLGRVVLTSVDSLTATTVTSIQGALFLGIASLVTEGPSAWVALLNAPPLAWYSLICLAFGATALAYAWYFRGVQVLGAGPAAAYIALVPVFGVLASSLWLGEPLTFSLLTGGILAISGMAIMNLGHAAATKRR